ncbi:uncharacterized protein [Palaemon carinicauda]|uniref:uncharacterized protein n=1 Tax=Palaemon carinicauda TaxID=392227 RepID=UPI0035B65722
MVMVVQFEKKYKAISSLDFYDPSSKGIGYFKQSLRYLANWSFHFCDPLNNKYSDKGTIGILKNLSNNDSLVIIRPDKGNGVVLLDKNTYVGKMLDILNDRSKFAPLTSDTFSYPLKYEDKVNRFLRKLKNNGVIENGTFQSLYCSESRPGIMYGLTKVLKNNCPLRPILSACGAHNYNVAKFLVPVIAPITVNEYAVKDSFSFAKEISNLNLGECTMASFDVESLFTNIPSTGTIDMCVEGLFGDEEQVNE